jgi:hypothetical protein
LKQGITAATAIILQNTRLFYIKGLILTERKTAVFRSSEYQNGKIKSNGKRAHKMRITEQDKRTFQKVADFMQRMDQNGVYYTIMEDLELINHKTIIAEILDIFRQWKSDINSPKDPKYKAICNFEFDLIAML